MMNGPKSLEPRLPDDLVMAIGRVTVLGTRLESDVVVHLWSAAGLNPKPESISKRPDVFQEVIKRLRRHVRENFRGPAMADMLMWLHRAKKIQEQRHLVVHGLWSAVPKVNGKHAVRTQRDPTSIFHSVYDVNEIADEIQRTRAASSVVSHWLRIQSAEAAAVIHPVTVEEMRELSRRADALGIA